MEILNNAWVVGVGGGILSGLVVAWITRAIFAKRDNKEYLQKVFAANKEVLYAIRPGISEGVIPDNDVLRHLISATARKYEVEKEAMFNLDELSSELVKEVMDSSFISASVKSEFCQKLTEIKEPSVREAPLFLAEDKAIKQYRRQTTAVLSLVAGALTGIAAVYLSKGSSGLSDLSSGTRLLLLVLPVAVTIAAVFVTVLYRELEKSKLTRFTVNLGGIRAEFKGKNEDERT